MPETSSQLPPERKFLFVLGNIIAGVGLLLFLSVFVTSALHFGDFSHFESRVRGEAIRAVLGFIMMIIGGVIHGVGRSGLAGAGFLPDPDQMREDLKPWNRAAGQMTNDSLSEIGLVQKLEKHLDQSSQPTPPPPPHVKIRCRTCDALNDEQAKFCNQCGAEL